MDETGRDKVFDDILGREDLNDFATSKKNLDELVESLKIKVQEVGSFATHEGIQKSLATILDLKSTNKLTKAIGNASDLELASY